MDDEFSDLKKKKLQLQIEWFQLSNKKLKLEIANLLKPGDDEDNVSSDILILNNVNDNYNFS